MPRAVWPLLAALVALLACVSSLWNGFALDDVPLVRDNPELAAPRPFLDSLLAPYWPESQGGIAAGLYRPLTLASFRLGRALFGPGPLGHHAVNLLLHAWITALVWAVARGTGRYYGTALATALLFAVHPLHSEAVANIAGRAELLGAVAVLLAWLAHRRVPVDPHATRRLAWAACAGLGYLAALLSKENTILAPALFFIDDRWRAEGRGRVATYGAYGLALAVALGLRVAALGGLRGAGTVAFIDSPASFAGVFARVATALWVQLLYLGKLVFPVHLSSDYSFDAIPVVARVTDPRFALGTLWVAALLAVLFVARRRSRVLAVSIGTWLLFLLPTSNLLFSAGTVMAERLAYLASLGGCLLAGHGVAWLAARAGVGRRRALATAFGLLVVFGGFSTALRCRDWRDNLTLALTDVRTQPRSAKLHAGAAIALHAAGRADEAVPYFREALSIYPDYAQVRFNLGQLLAERGIDDEAIEHLSRAAQLSPQHPGPPRSLALLLERQGRTDEALEAYAEAVRLDPGDLGLRFNLGRALLAARRDAEALALLERLAREDAGRLIGELARALAAEAGGRSADAAEIYIALLGRSNLGPAVRRRIEEQLDALGGAGR